MAEGEADTAGKRAVAQRVQSDRVFGRRRTKIEIGCSVWIELRRGCGARGRQRIMKWDCALGGDYAACAHADSALRQDRKQAQHGFERIFGRDQAEIDGPPRIAADADVQCGRAVY
jgi:hypothetical protein